MSQERLGSEGWPGGPVRIRYLAPLSLLCFVVLYKYSLAELVSFSLCYLLGYLLFYALFQYKECIFNFALKFVPASVNFDSVVSTAETKRLSTKECNICGGVDCLRRSTNSCHEPWIHLEIHKQLDQAIEDFFNAILDTFVVPWYSQLTDENTLIFELRFILRYASSSLLNRALKADVGEVILKKLVPCALRHWAVCEEARRIKEAEGLSSLEEAALRGPLTHSLHPALRTRESELEYLRCITEEIMPELLPKQECESQLFSSLIREIFAGWVLLSITDILADPAILNTLVILATGDEKMSQLPELPSHRVKFLENFVANKGYRRMRLLTLEVPEILKSPEYLYSFMQFMKSTGKIHLLQCYLDLDEFNKKMLQPEMSYEERAALYKRASELFSIYFSHESSSFISLESKYIRQFKAILDEGVEQVAKLQRSEVLYEAYDYVYSLLEKEWAPRFFDSYEFYKLIMPHVAVSEPKKTAAKPEKNSSSVIGKPLSKLKDAFKSQAVDGQIDISDTYLKTSDTDSVDNMDMESQYSDILANYTRLKNKDMTSWRVSIEEVVEGKIKNKIVTVHWFLININKTDPHGVGGDSQWVVERNDQDFYTLKEKLVEFHGENMFADIQTPSKKIKAAAEIRKLKYEVFLQNLLIIPVLKSSDLVHLFLTANSDFTLLAREASNDSSSLPDLGSMYQNVTHKLRKERGQHLDAFLQTFLISSDLEYYQSMTEDRKCEEEAIDAMKDETLTTNKKVARSLTNCIFGNNFDLDPSDHSMMGLDNQPSLNWSLPECIIFILNDVFKVRHWLVNIYGYLCQSTNINNYSIKYLNKILKEILSEPRLGHLIKLGQDVIFNDSTPPSMDQSEKLKLARTQLLEAFPYFFVTLAGPDFLKGVDTLFEYLQHPKLNKQLVYTLLDVIIMELFPELRDKS